MHVTPAAPTSQAGKAQQRAATRHMEALAWLS
jgi:hypothetical protein